MLNFFIDHPIIAALVALSLIGIIFGTVLGFAAIKYRVAGDPIVEKIDEILPQTQCGQCGHPGCRPYAEAIANGEEINKCPPGGQSTVNDIAQLLGVDAPELDVEDASEAAIKKVAVIREDECIGCTKCIQACPVDAILGAAKQMHTVISHECTGCDLCVEPCPVDCIDMIAVPETIENWQWKKPDIIATDRQPSHKA